MLWKNTIKNIKSLHLKKFRNEDWLFLVEWQKSLQELLNSNLEIISLYITEEFFSKNRDILSEKNYEIISIEELQKITTLQINTDWIAVVKQLENKFLKSENDLVLVLDDIKDPWNLWTITRIADWYWITKIIASNNTVEFYNPKVIISTMWSFTRVKLFYTDLVEYFSENKHKVYGAFLNWENIHKTTLEKSWYIIIWNESNGISWELENFVTNKITIPRFWAAESLNAWVATWIILDNFLR